MSDGSLVCIERFKNGVKKSEDISRDGRFYGTSIKWYRDGVKKGEGNFIGDEIKKIGKREKTTHNNLNRWRSLYGDSGTDFAGVPRIRLWDSW